MPDKEPIWQPKPASGGGVGLLRPCTSRFLQPDQDIPAAVCALHGVMLLVIVASSLVRMWRRDLLSVVLPCKQQTEMALEGGNILGVEGTCFISDGSALLLEGVDLACPDLYFAWSNISCIVLLSTC